MLDRAKGAATATLMGGAALRPKARQGAPLAALLCLCSGPLHSVKRSVSVACWLFGFVGAENAIVTAEVRLTPGEGRGWHWLNRKTCLELGFASNLQRMEQPRWP